MLDNNPACERCGGPTYYKGYVSAPSQSIYGCDNCGRYTWVKVSAQQPQPQTPEHEVFTNPIVL